MSVRNRTDLFSQFRNSYHCGEEREVPFQAKDGGTKKLSASGYHAIPLAILSASASGDGDNFFGLW